MGTKGGHKHCPSVRTRTCVFKITLHINIARDRPAILEASPNKLSIGPLGLAGSVEREVVEVP